MPGGEVACEGKLPAGSEELTGDVMSITAYLAREEDEEDVLGAHVVQEWIDAATDEAARWDSERGSPSGGTFAAGGYLTLCLSLPLSQGGQRCGRQGCCALMLVESGAELCWKLDACSMPACVERAQAAFLVHRGAVETDDSRTARCGEAGRY